MVRAQACSWMCGKEGKQRKPLKICLRITTDGSVSIFRISSEHVGAPVSLANVRMPRH